MSSILIYLKLIYNHKEKIVLSLLIIAFAVVGYQQYKLKKNLVVAAGGDNPGEIKHQYSPTRTPASYSVQPLTNPYPLDSVAKLIKNIFNKPEKEDKKQAQEKKVEWAGIKVKSVFDPTQSGSYIAIIEVDKRSRIVKEGQQFEQSGDYEVQRIDGVKSCLSIKLRQLDEEREFCKEE